MNTLNGKIIAHRGESFLAPENTLASVYLAWKLGASSVEVDVQLTKDNEIIVIHNNNTKRTTNQYNIVKSRTLSELKKLDVGSFKSEGYKNEKIPTLNEVLNTIPPKKKLIIEIKSDNKIISVLQNQLKESNLQNNQIEIISFNFDTICLAKKEMPHYKALWLLDLDYYWYTSIFAPNSLKIIQKLNQNNLDGIDVWAGKFANEKFLKTFKDKNFLFYLWTIDEPSVAKKYLEWGADAVTTNRANWLENQIQLI